MVSVGLPSIGGRCGRESDAWVALSGSTSHGERQADPNRGVLSEQRVTASWWPSSHGSSLWLLPVEKTEQEHSEVKTETLFRHFIAFNEKIIKCSGKCTREAHLVSLISIPWVKIQELGDIKTTQQQFDWSFMDYTKKIRNMNVNKKCDICLCKWTLHLYFTAG